MISVSVLINIENTPGGHLDFYQEIYRDQSRLASSKRYNSTNLICFFLEGYQDKAGWFLAKGVPGQVRLVSLKKGTRANQFVCFPRGYQDKSGYGKRKHLMALIQRKSISGDGCQKDGCEHVRHVKRKGISHGNAGIVPQRGGPTAAGRKSSQPA